MVIYFNIFLIVFFTLLPAFIWMSLFLKEDPHPEPKNKILMIFIGGIAFSAPALLLEFQFYQFFPKSIFGLIGILFIAFVEEAAKFLAVFIGNKRNIDFDEPIDAMIYMIVGALGFATVENFFIVIKNLESLNIAAFLSTLNIISTRFIGATLLHILSSAVWGYYWALSHFNNKKNMFWIGMFLAVIIHSIFNFMILNSGVKYMTHLFLLTVAFFVFLDFEKIKKSGKNI